MNKRLLAFLVTTALVFNVTSVVQAVPQAIDKQLNYTIATSDNADEKNLEVPKAENKSVYIVLPGIMGSELYAQSSSGEGGITDLFGEYKENGYRFWEFHYGLTELITKQSKRDILNLKCNEMGESINEISADAVNDSIYGNDGEYGSTKMYTKMVKGLKDEFGEDNVIFFPYDWRMSIESAAESLKKYIDDNDYENINIVAHSMGGLVACEYIKMAPEKKDNIKLITLGTPYLGAPTALWRTEKGQALVTNSLFSDSIGEYLYNLIDLRNEFKEVMSNMRSVYELLPTSNYFTYKNENIHYVDKYKAVWYGFKNLGKLNYSETKSLITDRSWGNKYLLDSSENTHNELSVLDAFNSVDSYAVIGYNQDTPMVISEYFHSNGEYMRTEEKLKLKGGDGTVPIASATIGGKISEDKDFYVKEEHPKLQENDAVLDFVCKKFKNWNSTDYSDEIIEDCYDELKKSDWLRIKIERVTKDGVIPKILNNEKENISIPDIKVYSPKGEVIVEINDKKLDGEINDYGSFSISEGEGSSSISENEGEFILSLDVPESGNYRVEVSGEGTYNVEMVQGTHSTDEEGNLDLDKYLAGNVIETDLYKGTIESYELKEQDLITINLGKDGDYIASLDKGSNGKIDEKINIKKALDGVLSDNTEPTMEVNINEKNKNKSIVSIKANDDVSINKIMYIVYNPEKENELSVEPQIIYENTKNEVCKEIELKDIYTFKNKNDGEIMKIVAIDMNDNVVEAEYVHHKKAGDKERND